MPYKEFSFINSGITFQIPKNQRSSGSTQVDSFWDLLDDDFKKKNKIYCRYLIGLGHLGIADIEKAGEELEKVIQLDENHLELTSI